MNMTPLELAWADLESTMYWLRKTQMSADAEGVTTITKEGVARIAQVMGALLAAIPTARII